LLLGKIEVERVYTENDSRIGFLTISYEGGGFFIADGVKPPPLGVGIQAAFFSSCMVLD